MVRVHFKVPFDNIGIKLLTDDVSGVSQGGVDMAGELAENASALAEIHMRQGALMVRLLAVFGLGVWAGGCSSDPPPTQAPEVATHAPIPVLVDEAPVGQLQIPPGAGPWPLVDLLPQGTVPMATWDSVDIRGAQGQLARLAQPAELVDRRSYQLMLRDGQPAFVVSHVVDASASASVRASAKQPLRTVPLPVQISIYTEPRVKAVAWGKLRTTVDGRGSGFLREEELAAVPLVRDACRTERDAGWPVATLAGLRIDGKRLDAVTVTAEAQSEHRLEAAALTDPSASHYLKLNKQGAWSYKQVGPAPGCEVLKLIRDVSALGIETAPPG